MHTRPIPSSGEMLPVVGLGTWRTFDIGPEKAELAHRQAVLETLFAGGGSVIDSSPMYGRAEAVVGGLLTNMSARQRAFIATKVWTTGEAAGITEMERSAKRMAAPVVDLMQIHNLVDWRTQLATLRQWKAAGRIRYLGLTHHTVAGLDDLAAVIEREQVDFVQFAYSAGERAAERRLLPLAAEKGVAVLVNKPFGSGGEARRLVGRPLPVWAQDIGCESWSQILLKYIIANPAVTCVIPGTSQPGHMRDNIGAGEGMMLDAGQRARIIAALDDA